MLHHGDNPIEDLADVDGARAGGEVKIYGIEAGIVDVEGSKEVAGKRTATCNLGCTLVLGGPIAGHERIPGFGSETADTGMHAGG